MSRGQPMLRQQPGWVAGGMVAPGNTLGFGPTLGWEKPCKTSIFPADKSCNRGSSHWESSAHHHSLGCATTEPLGWSWRRWGHKEPSCPVPPGAQRREEAQAEIKLNRAWAEGSLILAPGTIQRDLFLGSGLSLRWGIEWKMYI